MLPLLRQNLDLCASSWEAIVIDGGSTDATARLLVDWVQQPGFRAVHLSRNFGKEVAITAGPEAALGDVVNIMDADLQHPPELVVEFVDQWRRGADMVYAVRAHRHDESLLKRFGARFLYALLYAADRFAVPEGAGDFRLMARAVVDALLALAERNRFMKGPYAWVGFRSVAVPCVPAPRLQAAATSMRCGCFGSGSTG